MERRNWLKAMGVTAAAAALPFDRVLRAVAAAPDGRATIESEVKRLNLRHTWTTTMSSSAYRDTLFVRYTRDGITGVGEGAPIVRYQEDAAGGKKVVDGLADFLGSANPQTFQKINAELLQRVSDEWAAKAAIDIAILDWVGQKMGVPIYRLFGLDAADAPITTFSIGIDNPETTGRKCARQSPSPC